METAIIIKKATAVDALKLSILFKQVYIQTYGTEGITDEFANFITMRFAPERIEAIIENEPDRLLVAFYKNNPVGAAEIIYDASCRLRNIAAPELSKLYVLERFCRKGIGYQLLLEAEKEILSKGYHELWLEVLTDNGRAVSFYERQQYKSIGNIDFVMAVNTYKNSVMSKQLNNLS